MTTETGSQVGIWVDPLCSWAWSAARWLLEVERVRPVRATFHVMSIAVLHEGQADVDPRAGFLAKHGWGPARVCTAAAEKYGAEALRSLYLELAASIHDRRAGWGAGVVRAALAGAGLDPVLADAAQSIEYDEALRASHHAGVDPVGEGTGIPVTHVPLPGGGTSALFGPVLGKVPVGAAAGRLWDAVLTMAGTDGCYEIKRARPAASP